MSAIGTGSKIAIGIAALALIGGAGAWAYRVPLGIALTGQLADHYAGRDVTTDLPDGLHVVLCGTGSPLPDLDRAGPCTAIIAGKRLFVVDAGEGGARTMAYIGLPMNRIESVFLTHFHSDHIDGLGPMMLLRWTGASATSPLPIAGPEGVQAIVAGFNAAYKTDYGFRTAHHGAAIAPPSGAGGTAMPFPLPGEKHGVVILDDGGVRVTAFRVNHGGVSPAVGYRFDYKGRSVTISGDTAVSPSLERAARGTDVLVHEALQPTLVAQLTRALEVRGVRNTAQITRDILDYHATPEQAADAARRSGAHMLLFTHLLPQLPTRLLYPAFLGDAPQHYKGPITMGEDGMIVSLPAGSTEITKGTLG